MTAQVVRHVARCVASAGIDAAAWILSRAPDNDWACVHTIRGGDGSPYLTRTLLPRVLGVRLVSHRIWRADRDPDLHNHPWDWAAFRVVSGGYTEERWVATEELTGSAAGGSRGPVTAGRVVTRVLVPGDVNWLRAEDFHRIVHVLPGTRTVGVLGERAQDWGFWVDGAVVPHGVYFARQVARATKRAGRPASMTGGS